MVNPLLTALFDLFLIGCAAGVIAGMVKEYLDHRTPSVGRTGAVPEREIPPAIIGSPRVARTRRPSMRAHARFAGQVPPIAVRTTALPRVQPRRSTRRVAPAA